ncbi:M23 family metallopeptidase [Kribbella sp. DT2]
MRLAVVFGTAAAGVTAAGLLALSGLGLLDRAAVEAPAKTAAPQVSASTAPGPSVAATPDAEVGATPSPSTVATSPHKKVTPSPVRLPPIRYVFPVQGCVASASQAHHDYPAADIFAKAGCRFVAPVDGRVDEVTRVDRWDPKTNVGADRGGLAVSVVGRDGVRYYGSHLSSIAAGIRPGVEVRAGQVLGLTGRTGSARSTPAHLHFGISWPTAAGRWWIRRGAVPPQGFLSSLDRGKPATPAGVVGRAKAAYGVDRGCREYC